VSGAWGVEAHQGSAADFHARAVEEPAGRLVWWSTVDRPALVLGSAQRPEVADAGAMAAAGVELVRRRSGGGAVLLVPGEVVWVDVIVPAGDPLWDDDVGRATHWLGATWARALAACGMPDATVHRGPMIRTPWSSLVFGKNISRLLIMEDTREATDGGPTCVARLPTDWADVAEDYRHQNAVSHRLVNGFDLGLPYDLLSFSEQRALDAKEIDYLERLPPDQPGFQHPYSQVPGGKLLYLSAVGFNAERTRAMFMLSYACGGPMCAGGWQLRRIKENGVWQSPSEQADDECRWLS